MRQKAGYETGRVSMPPWRYPVSTGVVGFGYVFLEFCILVVCRNTGINIGRNRFGRLGGIMGGRRRILLPMGTSGNYPFARTTISCEMV